MASPLESQEPASAPTPPRDARGGRRASPDPTPLEAFDRSVKAPQQLALILRLLGQIGEHRCLFLSTGGGRGALEFHLRAAGGGWTWASTRTNGIPPAAELLGETVTLVAPPRLPFADHSFDRVVAHHLPAHLLRSPAFRRETQRTLVPGGITVWTAPNGNPWLPANALRRLTGRPGAAPREGVVNGRRSSSSYGGMTFREMEAMALDVGLAPIARGGCSRFFTEIIHWMEREPGPLLRGLAVLDHLIPGAAGYDLAVAARKPSGPRLEGRS